MQHITDHPSYDPALRGKGGIYRIVHVESGKSYIGRTGDFIDRWNTHVRDLAAGRHHSQYLQHAWEKYAGAAFRFEVVVEEADPQRRITLEQYYLDKRRFERGTKEFNMSTSASGPKGTKHSAKTREKNRRARLGYTWSEETRQRRAATNASRMPTWKELAWREGIKEANRKRLKGTHLSDEVKAKIRATQASHPLTPAQIAANMRRRGRAITEAQQEATRLRMERAPTEAETRYRGSQKGRTVNVSPEGLENIRKNQQIAAKASADARRGKPATPERAVPLAAHAQEVREAHRALIFSAMRQLGWGLKLPNDRSHYMACKQIAAITKQNPIGLFRSLNTMLEEGVIIREVGGLFPVNSTSPAKETAR